MRVLCTQYVCFPALGGDAERPLRVAGGDAERSLRVGGGDAERSLKLGGDIAGDAALDLLREEGDSERPLRVAGGDAESRSFLLEEIDEERSLLPVGAAPSSSDI